MEDHRSHVSNRRENSISGDIFSFPTTPQTPDSPTSDPNNTSPADHLFCNGKLLPHSFPPRPSNSSTSSRKDSLMSSRSNSVNSSRSSVSCSSGRTSSSQNSERKLLYRKYRSVSSSSPTASKLVMAQLYGSSQRWQHLDIVTLKREDSERVRSKCDNGKGKCQKEEKKKPNGVCLRFLKSLLVACRQCHAMEPSTNHEFLQTTA